MLVALQILSVILTAVVMAPALAHALELPGKRRLPKEAYFVVQRIYYPGFTLVGFLEPVAIIATGALLALTPRGSMDFWLTAFALLGLVSMHAVFWLITQPVNKVWLQDTELNSLGDKFFSLNTSKSNGDKQVAEWTALRDRWEYSHVTRAALTALSFIALVVAASSLSVA